MTTSRLELEQVHKHWVAAWPDALALWSRFTKLSPPRWCWCEADEGQEHLADSFAMIRLHDQAVVVSLPRLVQSGVQRFATEVLAHEIGHHIFVPANLLEHGRMLARMRRGLPDRATFAPLVANLYADLLINDRLQRQFELNIAGVYQALRGESQRPLWRFYLRTMEILWSLSRGALAQAPVPPEMEADAALAARVVRSFAREWLEGAGRYAVLCLSYLLQDPQFDPQRDGARCLGGWCDTVHAGQGAGNAPTGLTGVDADEAAGIIHPMYDPEISGVDLDAEAQRIGKSKNKTHIGGARGQCREPFEYGQIVRALGLTLSDHDIAVQYYRELATPYLVRFPVKLTPQASDPLPEGLNTWEFGQPLESLDWTESVLASPIIVPGVTTRERTWGDSEGGQPQTRPIDLDLYVDCSGSMPNPQRTLSPLALAGAIVALSAMRVGSSVQATLWSGARQFETTGGFVRDPLQVLRVLTGYIGGATAFPIHLLRKTFERRQATDRAVHIFIVSDDGVTTMFDRDELGNDGWDISAMALCAARGGGAMVLNLRTNWRDIQELTMAANQGWDIYAVRTLGELIPFAQQYSRKLFQRTTESRGVER